MPIKGLQQIQFTFNTLFQKLEPFGFSHLCFILVCVFFCLCRTSKQRERLSQAHVEKQVQREAVVSLALCGDSGLLTFTDEQRSIRVFLSCPVTGSDCLFAFTLSCFHLPFLISSFLVLSFLSLPAFTCSTVRGSG